jgi:hypothetical protein
MGKRTVTVQCSLISRPMVFITAKASSIPSSQRGILYSEIGQNRIISYVPYSRLEQFEKPTFQSYTRKETMSHACRPGGPVFPIPLEWAHCQASSVQFSSFLQNSPWPSFPSAHSPPVSGIRCLNMTLPNREWTMAIEHITHGSWVQYNSRSWHR